MRTFPRGLLLGMVVLACLVGTIYGCGINVRNNCPYSVTSCAQSGGNAIGQYQLGPGASQYLDFGSACRWPAGAVWASVGGRCQAGGNAAAAADRNLANLAEFTIGSNGVDYYDLSNVNAYTIGLRIRPTSTTGGSCGSPSCSISNIPAFCKGNNVLRQVASGAYVCINTDGTNGIGPTDGTRIFKAACPSSYSYNFDDATSTFTCNTGSSYEVVFCP